jgi:hypothetical protein
MRRQTGRAYLHAEHEAWRAVYAVLCAAEGAYHMATGRLVARSSSMNLKPEIAWQICDAMTSLGADRELLGAIAIWAEGEDDETVLNQLRSSIYKKVICRRPES